MSQFRQNKWNAIRAFYREALPDIVEAGANEWGIDAYEWDGLGIIHFTPIEQWLWHDIRACNAVLYPQFPINGYFVDFANPVAKVVVECDGAEWHDGEKDAIRDRNLEESGWSVYRFPGWMCRQDSDEETGAPSRAFIRMQGICEAHGISRFSRTAKQARDYEGDEDIVTALVRGFERSAAYRSAVERAK